MQRFAELMERELKSRGHHVRLIRPAPRFNRSGASPEGRAKWLGYLDKFVLFPPLLKRVARRFDVVHICDHSNAPYIHSLKSQPHVITCHDVLAIRSALGQIKENSTSWTGKMLQRIILTGLDKSAHVACVSINTRDELLGISKLKSENAVVIYNSINYPYAKMSREEAIERLYSATKDIDIEGLMSSLFIIHVGGNQWYKNRMGVLRIYRELCDIRSETSLPRLVMAGKAFDEEMRQFIRQHHLEEQVVEVENCSNEDLRAFYSLARVMLFPSLAEGFGWPVIEAQICGCPVLTSDFAPLTEIGGDVAIYCDPRSENEMAQRLNVLLDESEELHSARVRGGIDNARRFLPQEMVTSYLDLYQSAIKRRSTQK